MKIINDFKQDNLLIVTLITGLAESVFGIARSARILAEINLQIYAAISAGLLLLVAITTGYASKRGEGCLKRLPQLIIADSAITIVSLIAYIFTNNVYVFMAAQVLSTLVDPFMDAGLVLFMNRAYKSEAREQHQLLVMSINSKVAVVGCFIAAIFPAVNNSTLLVTLLVTCTAGLVGNTIRICVVKKRQIS